MVPVAPAGPCPGRPSFHLLRHSRGAPLTRDAPTGVQTACGNPDTELFLPWGLGLRAAQLSPRAAGR